MVLAWIGILAGVALLIAGIYFLKTLNKRDEYDRLGYRWGSIAAIAVGILLAAGLTFWLYGTEAGARAQKTFESTTGGGLTRVVTVYDMEGDVIERHEGKFDVDANAERIIFDVPQEDGSYLRVQIWPTTGTVTIVEK